MRTLALPDGATLAYEDVGEGQPVVFLHGFPLDHSMWAPQLRALAAMARCIAPDLRGLGESRGDSRGDSPSMERHADDVAALLDALAIPRAVVVGLSMGGYVALALWRRHRARVGALALVDTRAGADGDEAREKRHQLIALARAEGSAAVAERQLAGLVGKTTRAERPAVVEALRATMTRAPVEGIVGALEAMLARPDSTPLLATIDVPTLVVVGDEDIVTPPKEARAMAAQIPGARLEVVPGAGHMSNLERPEAFTAVLRGWLASLPVDEEELHGDAQDAARGAKWDAQRP